MAGKVDLASKALVGRYFSTLELKQVASMANTELIGWSGASDNKLWGLDEFLGSLLGAAHALLLGLGSDSAPALESLIF